MKAFNNACKVFGDTEAGENIKENVGQHKDTGEDLYQSHN